MLFASILVNLLFVGKKIYNRYQESLSEKPNKITYQLNRQTVYELLPVTKEDIVFAGDSHTEHFDLNEFFPNHPVKNRGISGDTSPGLLARFNQVVDGNPKKIFLEIGYNDFQYDIKPDSTIKNIALMVGQIKTKSPKSAVYIISVFPSTTVVNGINPVNIERKLNKDIRLYTERNKVHFIDLYSKLSNNGSLNKKYDAGDGIHLNGEGYTLWTKTIKEFVD